MIGVWTIVLIILVFILCKVYMMGRCPKGMPPGPSTWPFIGNLNLVYNEKKVHLVCTELGKKYGGIFSIQYALHPGIIITDLSIAKEAFVTQADIFSERHSEGDLSKSISAPEDKGLITQNGERWRRLRKLAVQSMRDLGVGKTRIEQEIQEEANEIRKEIEKHDGQYFALEYLFNKAVTNVICVLLFDKRYAYDDPSYTKQIDNFNKIVREFGFANVFSFLPWYTFILMPVLKPNIRSVLGIINDTKKWVMSHVTEHRETLDENNLRDFVDRFIFTESNSPPNTYSEKMMISTIFELFGSGSETTSTTLLWAIIYLTKFPEIQDKCRQEIQQNIGNREITYADREKAPYLEATINEIMRRANIVPMVIAHATKTSTTLRGYEIPRQTIVTVNTYAIHMDPKHWPEPTLFKPERFLDEQGKVIKPEAFIPFGIGRRACLGETLARIELFIFLAELLQKFEFHAEDPLSLPTPEETNLGVTLIPEKFYVKAVKII